MGWSSVYAISTAFVRYIIDTCPEHYPVICSSALERNFFNSFNFVWIMFISASEALSFTENTGYSESNNYFEAMPALLSSSS